jgi:hypothetical protein
MSESGGKNDYRQLPSGEEISLWQPTGGKWHIGSVVLSWTTGMYIWEVMPNLEKIGWDNRTFDTPDEAYSFVDREIQAGRVPGIKRRPKSEG